MSVDLHRDSELLKALGHPLRLKIVMGLLEAAECNVNTIVARLGIPQSTASQHLGILKHRGIIAPRKEGVKTCYRVVDRRIAAIVAALRK